jgi:cytoskeletal protein CcmA (bactofilin family)
MFGRDERETDVDEERIAGSIPEERRVAAWIGSQIVIKGDLTSSEDLTIAGRVEGDVSARAHTLVVAPGASISGNIIARTVSLYGQVTGTITAERKLEVASTGSVDGEVTTPRLVIAEGAELEVRAMVGLPASAAIEAG